MRYFKYLILILTIQFLITQPILGAVPQLINYQGAVTVNGEPFGSAASQTGYFWFGIAGSDGIIQWSSDGNSTPVEFESIWVTNGQYHVILGDPDIMPPFSAGLFTQDELYLRIWFNDGTTGPQQLAPDKRLTSQAYALNSDTLDGQLSSSFFSKTDGVLNGPLHVQDDFYSTVNNVTFHLAPQGTIGMWSGTIASIPTGWQLCDGTNLTPDLRDQFVTGVASGQDPGDTGGTHQNNLTVNNLPAHSHSSSNLTHGGHTHEADTDHRPVATFWLINSNPTTLAISGLESHDRTTIGGGDHGHGSSETNDTGNGTTFDNRPAFYRLAFIMKL